MFFDYDYVLIILCGYLFFSIMTIYLTYRYLKWSGRIGLFLLSFVNGFIILSSFVDSLGHFLFQTLIGNLIIYLLVSISGILIIIGVFKKQKGKDSFFKSRFELLKTFSNLQSLYRDEKFEHPQSYVLKVNSDGNIIFCTKNFQDLFDTKEEIIGRNVLELNESIGHFDHTWFYEALKNRSWYAESRIVVNDEIKWISWCNDTILDENDNMEFILCTGFEVTRLMQTNEKLEQTIILDPLTNMLNYRGLVQKISEQKNVKSAICFFISIQNISLIQNYYGINVSEEVIKEISEQISLYSERGYLCGRITGSGNVLIVFNPTEKEIKSLIKELEASVLTDVKVNGIEIHIKKNIGYAVYPEQSDDIVKLISLSNLAMIDAAHNEHNEVTKYHHQMSKNLEDNISIAMKLREAINENKIDIYFQKIVNTQTNEVEFLEALARWEDKELGRISPSVFLKIARTSNLIDKLEEYLITHAMSKFATLKKQLEFKNTILSINLSPSSFLHERFTRYILDQVLFHKLKPQDVCIEISENTFIYNLDICNYFVRLYKEKGFLIAIDDFGKEYSSLSVLGSLVYDIIKIDGSFVMRIFSQKNQAIIEMIVKIANLYNHRIIAESVETEEQAQALQELNCFIQQGYYFHKPEKII